MQNLPKIRIVITDDHTLIRQTWSFILNADPRFEVVAECGNAENAIDKIKLLRPDIVLMDINLPGMNGIDATRQIKKFVPGTKVIGVSTHTQPIYVRKMLAAGAAGYVTKNSTKEEMIHAITHVQAGNKYVCREIKSILTEMVIGEENDQNGVHSLTEREMLVIHHVTKGSSSKEIAALLNISSKTVEVHRYNILKKLKLKNSSSLVNYVHNHALGLTISP